MRRRPKAVALERRGHLAEIVLDLSASRGRFTAGAAAELVAACAQCEGDDVWVVLLRSRSASFALGVDGAEWPDLSSLDFVAALAAVRQPVVAALRGRVEAEGFELALAADLRVVEPGTRFRMTQLAQGRIPGHGGTQRLPRIVGVERALSAILLGEPIGAREAARRGLAQAVARSADREARRLAGALLERGPIALRFAKEAVRRSADLTLDDGARFEHDLYVLLETTRDRAEGVAAFLGKRKPIFQGV
jgi:enoyl-CoA hydratase/carnithine racemase